MSYASLAAFRAHCGELTMPIEQCPLCSKIKDHCSRSHHYEDGVPDHHDDTPPEVEQLGVLLDSVFVGSSTASVLQCPTCRRLYVREMTFVGESTFWSWDRYDVAVLFDLQWCVKQRLPDRDVRWVHPCRFFPSYALVNLGANGWGALDANNRLLMLDSHDAIINLIESDPPRVTGDIELAKRYATFIDELENPDDARPGGEKIPIATATNKAFESLDAFRSHCGTPTMPLEGCPICNEIPERCHKSDDDPPPGIERLEHFFGEHVRRCPICRRLYLYELTVFGNDIYTGNDDTWSLDRCDADVLFDLEWCVKQRLPGFNVSWVPSEQLFPNHVLVDFGSNVWGALDRDNRLINTVSTAREGDRVIVRSWVTSQKRLIYRSMTVQPDGHYIREDAVIAENLPIR